MTVREAWTCGLPQASIVSPVFSGYMNIRLAPKQVHAKCTKKKKSQLQVIRKSIENMVKIAWYGNVKVIKAFSFVLH
jgi:hypothetical protein